MTETKKSHTTVGVIKSSSQSQGSIFVAMAFDMSWRLAIAILVPVIGGALLDKQFKTSPAFLIAGFLLAMIGMSLVLWKTLQAANQLPVPKLTAAQKRAVKKSYDEDDD